MLESLFHAFYLEKFNDSLVGIGLTTLTDFLRLQRDIGSLWGGSHSLSEAIAWYYAGPYLSRFQHLRDDVASGANDVDTLAEKTYERTHGLHETANGVGLIAQLGGGAGADIQRACCRAFANYILGEL